MKKIVYLVCFFFFLTACGTSSGPSRQGKYPQGAKTPVGTSAQVQGRSVPESTPVRSPEEPLSVPLSDLDDKISGVVVEVIDGDRLVFRLPDHSLFKVRLAGIDSPGLKQPYGLRARDYLVKICAKKEAWIIVDSMDKSRNVVGRVYCLATPDAEPVDAMAEQLRRGVAWVAKENSDADLKAIESEARSRRRGLWTDPNPVPPWNWEEK